MNESKCRRLEGRVAVVTGGASGIGLASVRRLADEGARIVIGDVDPGSGEAAAAEVDGIFVKTDVTSAEDVAAMFRTAKEAFGSIDIAFNNAGISPPDDDSILETGIDAWRRVQEVNLTSVYLCCKEVIPYMLEQGKGSIINVSSASAGPPLSKAFAYSVAKAGIVNLTQNLGREWAKSGVRVNAIRPGFFPTEWNRKNFITPEREAAILGHTPMGRFGEPSELLGATLWLASDASGFVTGAEVAVDGGFSCMTI
jgi:NAD(P)-dependent dehydrogenase (short-subunit alcohol dehydrogenase family)